MNRRVTRYIEGMSDATVSAGPAASHLRECPLCGLFQAVPKLSRGTTARCERCNASLRSSRTDPAGRSLAFATTALMLFLLAATQPFMELDLRGQTRQTGLFAGPEALNAQGMGELALVVLATTTIAPVLKLLATAWVLLGLRLANPPRSLATVFLWVERLSPWAMVEVFMLGVFVAYTKLTDLASVHVGIAVYALGGIMLAMAATDAALDHGTVWEEIEAHNPLPPDGNGPLIGCDACGLVSHHIDRCPRCGARLRVRKPNSLWRTWSLLLAAAILYIPANTLPVMTVIQLARGSPDTILSGVEQLATAGQWPLAALVFIASITVPVLKLLGLVVLLVTTQRRSTQHLRERTLLYRIVEAIGRWSMIDVFMVSILTALVRMGQLASITPGPGVICFCSVVILTILASHSFDPRLMWDVDNQPAKHSPA